jgi:hypothetical protein
METQDGQRKQSTTLYDVGGWFLITMVFGAYLIGVVIDYFWNYLVIFLTLRWQHLIVSIRRKLVYCIIVTALGLLIDWLYYELTWGTLVLGELRVQPVFHRFGLQPALELSTILVPMLVLGIVNFCASRLLLKLGTKQAIVLGAMMGVFTAPWLIVAFVLLNW